MWKRENLGAFLKIGVKLPVKFNSSPLKSYLNPIGNAYLPTIIFQGPNGHQHLPRGAQKRPQEKGELTVLRNHLAPKPEGPDIRSPIFSSKKLGVPCCVFFPTKKKRPRISVQTGLPEKLLRRSPLDIRHSVDRFVMGFSIGSWKENSGVTLPETNMAPYKDAFPKRNMIFQAPIFRCYVGFREGDLYTSENEHCIEPKNWTPGWGGEFSIRPFSGSTLVF